MPGITGKFFCIPGGYFLEKNFPLCRQLIPSEGQQHVSGLSPGVHSYPFLSMKSARLLRSFALTGACP